MSQETNSSIDFGGIEPAAGSEFLEPGMYRLKVDKDNTKVVAPEGKTPYVSVRFFAESGASVTEKFFLTAKALPRLQYLHEAWFNKRLDKKFTSMNDVGTYFVKALTSKIVTRNMITGGKITPDNKFYSGLPYTGFVIPEGQEFDEGPFEKDSVRYKQVVQLQKPNPAVAGTNAAILPNSDELPAGGYKPVDTGTDEMPW